MDPSSFVESSSADDSEYSGSKFICSVNTFTFSFPIVEKILLIYSDGEYSLFKYLVL